MLIIDAGHGGSDPGASGLGYVEKDLTLIISKRVKELLKEYNPDITRTSDISITNNDRINMIKDKYKYCLSIHINSVLGGKGTGLECIFSSVSSEGKKLAETITEELNKATGIKIRKPYSKVQGDGRDFYFMHRLTGNTITVIVECFFINNLDDIKLMNIESIAQGIAQGFTKHVGSVKESDTMLVYNRPLKRGSVGEDVKLLQIKLNELGYYFGGIDGSFGPAMDKAVRAYQSANSLVDDGSVGPATINKLNGKK